jgi:hypothetical protein
MFSDAEASALRQKFWTRFGQYMSPVTSAEGEKINWINYRTGVKNIKWKMETLNREASVSVIISGNEVLKDRFLQIFDQVKYIRENDMILEKDFMEHNSNNLYRLTKKLPGISVLDESKWPDLIIFFKENSVGKFYEG